MPARSRPQRRALTGTPRWAVLLVIGVAVSVCIGGIALVVIQSGQSPPSTAASDRAALTAYVAAIKGPTSQGGEVVAAEMRPSVKELTSGGVDGTTFAQRARGWKLEFERIRTRLDAVSTPDAVAAARPLFDQALQGYAQTASLYAQAGDAPGAQRASLLDQAASAGENADRLYDRAAAIVQAALHSAGLQPDPDLPDPATTSAP
jgi:hypothetical protein